MHSYIPLTFNLTNLIQWCEDPMVIQPNLITAAYGKPPFVDYTLLLLAIACVASSVGV